MRHAIVSCRCYYYLPPCVVLLSLLCTSDLLQATISHQQAHRMTHSLLCSVDKHCAKESHEPHPDMWKHQSFEWLRPQTLSADRRARWIITSILLLIISWTTSLYYSIPWPARQSSSEQNSFGQSSPLKTTPADVYPVRTSPIQSSTAPSTSEYNSSSLSIQKKSSERMGSYQ